MRSVGVRVALDHDQGLVPGDPLHGREVHARLNKVGDRRVAERVADNLIRI